VESTKSWQQRFNAPANECGGGNAPRREISTARVRLRFCHRLTFAMRITFPIRAVLFAGIIVYSAAFPGSRADELTGPPPPLPLAISEHITADVVDLIFLFDRVASDPPRATTPNYLAGVSEPSSPLNRDHLEYRQGKIDRTELANRLPHIAMMGDSLTQDFYFSSLASSFWRARTQWRKNWSSTPIPIRRAFSASMNDWNASHRS